MLINIKMVLGSTYLYYHWNQARLIESLPLCFPSISIFLFPVVLKILAFQSVIWTKLMINAKTAIFIRNTQIQIELAIGHKFTLTTPEDLFEFTLSIWQIFTPFWCEEWVFDCRTTVVASLPSNILEIVIDLE